ncbi:uncharacterized protein LOC130901436 isoform X1 [Diorhabda carinulata]|uniref:uncharacterized protein LOC130901436 isoform X1 n=2 Tax=Diorhabda carinulata TaxID=1163345 RepID=UPI0025A167B7|nr:uncharacterized protein LOC130901436 isoform X1 [Diorhabda carinulata]
MIQISVQKVSGCRKDSQEESGVVMENGPKDPLFEVQVSEHTKNGAVSTVMAKFPDWNIPINQENTTEHSKVANVNGDDINFVNNEENSLSSESDALIIDESVNKIQKNNKKPDQKLTFNPEEISNNCSETVTHSNPFFNESLFELTQLHQNNQEDAISSSGNKFEKNIKKYKKKLKPKHQITEYAQYLGLQPSVRFKCPKCSRTGFDTLPILQEHVAQCNEENVQDITQNCSSSGFKLTRKVFLCSACGTYYENWNLYIHMLEFHKRYICLYCLGMFSLLEDLCQHIQSKHNLKPGYKNTLDEFFSVYNEPCYIACCECDKLFSEQDNFFYHNCVGKNKPKKLPVKQQITPENHVTGESETNIEKVEPEVTKEQITDIMDSGVTQVVENAEPSIINGKHLTESNNDETEMSIENEEKEESSLSNGANNTESQSPKESLCPVSENMDDNKEDFEENQSFEDSIKQENTETSTDNCDISNNKSDYQNNINEHQADYNNSMRKDDQEVLDESEETRKVPKLSLKLPKLDSYEPEPEDSDDSEKLTMEVDQVESDDNENENELETKTNNEEQSTEEIKAETQEIEMQSSKKQENHHQVAGPDIPVIELQLEQPLDKFDPRILLQKCLKMTVPTCIYCNHARKIAVNGKQLGLHCIAEHRFSAIVNSITAEELIPQNFVNRISECLDELSSVFFNLESSFSNEAITFSHLFECFQCHFSTTVHKELYLHNRKYHSKNMLLCIMCKSNFYSYSELICHLCPGLYVLDYELTFKCCMCVHDDLPSSFRLMVHLRTKHNVCDVCLDSCHTQHRLSNHVWKHKLHHFCYRCGIAYRNKPDITRHLFWKHGTESVLCKKCLQKKWPHVYHFCIPPSSFGCDECGLTFSRAVYLKVHKRLHTNEYKHACTFEGCEEKFISKKLLATHERKHFEPPEEPKTEEVEPNKDEVKEEVDRNDQELLKEDEKNGEKPKPKIDVLEDLPALNLSESDSSSESETEANPPIKKQDSVEPKQETLNPETELEPPGELPPLDILQEHKSAIEIPEENTSIVMQGIWDNFKNYQEKQHKLDIMFNDQEKTDNSEISVLESEKPDKYLVLSEHNYCASPDEITKDTTLVEVKLALTESVDHDYCFSKPEGSGKEEEPIVEQPITPVKDDKKEATKNSSSSSSSDSDSSSCSCGSNCSCSSSSGSSCSSSDSSSSDSSSEEGRKRQLLKKEKRKERAKKLKEEQEKANKVDIVSDAVPIVIETPIRESDLETTESETDEEFYDEAPQKLAKKILEEKRQQLLELMGPNNIPNGSFIESTSRPPTPPSEVIEPEEKKKKKSKSKKKKKRKSEKKLAEYSEPIVNNIISPDIPIPPYYQQFHQQQQLQPQTPSIAPITLTISRNSPVSSPLPSVSTPVSLAPYSKVQTEPTFSKQDSVEKNLRASKRRRVPNKFYGYSSEEEVDKPVSKQRKTESSQTPRSPMVVPPITIKTPTPTPPQPPIEPISIRTGTHLSDFRVQRPRPKPSIPPIRLLSSRGLGDGDSESDSNDSSSDEQTTVTPKPAQPQLYCYCRCPYDEVSEMIGCDATDCEIEWFHFECVGIMVPPKGQWFCPDCRKKKTRREIMQQHMKNN